MESKQQPNTESIERFRRAHQQKLQTPPLASMKRNIELLEQIKRGAEQGMGPIEALGTPSSPAQKREAA